MEFLREILGDELFAQVEARINQHNGNEANKDKLVKLANLAGGEYVGKGKYDSEIEKLNGLLTGKQTELDTANGLIANLEKAAKGNAEMHGQFDAYKTQVQQLQEQLADTKRSAALKVGLIEAGCSDVEYVSYKILTNLKEQGKALEVDEDDHIKGWDELLSGAKTSLSNHFAAAGGRKVLGDNKLPQSDESGAMTKAELLRKPYAERAEYARTNPESYKNIMSH